MKDLIDERNERERISRSIVKYWNVNYIPRQVAAEDENLQKAEEVYQRLEDEAAADEAERQAEIEAAKREVEEKGLFNSTTGSYSGLYGANVDETDEVTKGKIDRILQEKEAAIQDIIAHEGRN